MAVTSSSNWGWRWPERCSGTSFGGSACHERRFQGEQQSPQAKCARDPTNASENPPQRRSPRFESSAAPTHPRLLRADAGCLRPPRRAFLAMERRQLGNVGSGSTQVADGGKNVRDFATPLGEVGILPCRPATGTAGLSSALR